MVSLLLDGLVIHSENDFHDAVAAAFNVPYYGRNLDALDEVLADLVGPVHVRWINAQVSEAAFGDRFGQIVEVINEVQAERADNFSFRLEM